MLDRGPGTFSGHIAKLDVGEELELQGIRGEIKIPRDIQTAVLIAGGVGVTLILSVARELARMRVPLEIHYAARSQPHLSFLDDLQAVELSVLKTYTPDLQEFRRMDIRTILTEADRDAHIYVCGPYSMIEETRQVASEIGFLDRRVHFESFGSFWKPDDRDLTVHLKQSEMTIRVPVGTSILDAMLAQGVWASFECKRGECGDCSVGFSGGVADHRDHALSSDARSSMICTCVSWAKTDSIELDL